jgi:hypothetical protein
MDAAIAALLGALLGAAASVGAMIIQQRHQNRRDLLKIATDLAREDWKNRFEIIAKQGGEMPPISVFVRYHHRVLLLLADGKFSPSAVQALGEEQEAVLAAYRQAKEQVARAQLQSS